MGKKGVALAVEAIQYLDPQDQERLLKNVAKLDPKVAKQLRSELFGFEDLTKISPKGIAVVVGAVSEGQWSLALRKASLELGKHIFSNISQRRAEQIKEAIKSDGPKPLSKVLEAQQQIVNTVLELEKKGEIAVVRDANYDPLV